LCGGFNSNIIKGVNKRINEEFASQAKAGNVKVLSIGKKASESFSKKSNMSVGDHNSVYAALTFDNVAPIAEKIMADFASGNYDRVEIVYNLFKNAAVQYVTTEQLLPITPPSKNEKSKAINDYIFEPSKEQIVTDLIPRSIKTQLYKALLDSHASEHGARMTAMSKATDNAQELLRDLRINYNKARQASITNEILEIVAGAEALNG
jgi:F-type H+-transporting ATPase subunit gamma